MKARLAAVGGLLVVLSVWTHARPRATEARTVDFSTIPLTLGDWVGRDAPPLDPEVARVLAADQYVHRYYGPRTIDGTNEQRTTTHEQRIEMDIAYYAQPQAGAAMHSPLNCLPGNGWQVMESRMAPVQIAGGEAVDVRRLIVARGSHRVAMSYWFQNRGAVVGHEYGQRLHLLTNGLRGRPTDAALVRVMALDTAQGHRALERFTRDLVDLLGRTF
jgi:EpsI family protein